MIQKRTIGIVGTGNVGVAAAYAVFLRGVASDIVLVDKDERRAEGEAMDLMHGQPYVEKISVRAGGYRDLAEAQIIVVSAGVGQKTGESRLDLLNRNIAVMRGIVEELDRYAPDAVLIIASNPVDLITYGVQQISRRAKDRVVGTGTMLDTGRFRSLLGRHYGVDPRSVHAYIIGEHGDSEVPVWSSAHIGGVTVSDHTIMGKPFEPSEMSGIFKQVREAAYEIIDRKGYTNTAIGSVIARLAEAIIEDQKSVFTLSIRLSGEYGLNDLCASIPCVVGSGGIEARILPDLTALEREGLERSAQLLKDRIDSLDL